MEDKKYWYREFPDEVIIPEPDEKTKEFFKLVTKNKEDIKCFPKRLICVGPNGIIETPCRKESNE